MKGTGSKSARGRDLEVPCAVEGWIPGNGGWRGSYIGVERKGGMGRGRGKSGVRIERR